MKTLFTTSLGRFKIAAFLEGITFLILVGIAMPLKYVWHKPEWVQNMGMFHGISFVMYLLLLLQNKVELGWETRKTMLAIALSFVPFGPFYVVRKMIPEIGANR